MCDGLDLILSWGMLMKCSGLIDMCAVHNQTNHTQDTPELREKKRRWLEYQEAYKTLIDETAREEYDRSKKIRRF